MNLKDLTWLKESLDDLEKELPNLRPSFWIDKQGHGHLQSYGTELVLTETGWFVSDTSGG